MPIGDYPPHPLEVGQVKRMLRVIRTKSRKGLRDQAIIAIFWRCGLRNTELRLIELDHLGQTADGERFIRVMSPKGRKKGAKPRNLGIDAMTWDLIEKWLEERGTEPGLLFPSRTGVPIMAKVIRDMVKSRGAQAGLSRRVHPHCFRHTFAKDLLEEGENIVVIQHALGHTSLERTAQYLQHIGCDEVVSVTSQRSWTI